MEFSGERSESAATTDCVKTLKGINSLSSTVRGAGSTVNRKKYPFSMVISEQSSSPKLKKYLA
jgi:hypothetical protein